MLSSPLSVGPGRGVAEDVRFWYANASTNFGWLFAGDEAQEYSIKEFASRHFATNTSWRPVLTVEYQVAPAKTNSALQIALPLLVFSILLVGGGVYIQRRRASQYKPLN